MTGPVAYARQRVREGMTEKCAAREAAVEFDLDELEEMRVEEALCCGCANPNCQEEDA